MTSSAYDEARRALWLFGAILAILYIAGGALLPFILGALFASVLHPLQQRLHAFGLSRWLSALLLSASVTAAFTATMLYAIPGLILAIESLFDAASAAFPEVLARIEDLTGMAISAPAKDVISDVTDGDLEPLIEPATSATPLVLSLLGSAFNAILIAFVTPIVMFYLLTDWKLIDRAIRNWVPEETARELADIWELSKSRGLQYVWGRTVVVFWVSLLHIAGLWLIGLDEFWVVGIIAGLSVIIPILGNIAALVLGLVAGALQSTDPAFLLAIVAVFAAAQIIEMVWVEPYFLGNSLNLHPFVVLLVLLLGGHLLGPIGAIVALPVAAIALSILESARALQETTERRSEG